MENSVIQIIQPRRCANCGKHIFGKGVKKAGLFYCSKKCCNTARIIKK